MGYTLGADPELFLRSKKTGQFVSAYGKFQGTKKKPKKIEHGAYQVDGLALEFNIDPAKNVKEFTRNIQSVLKQLKDVVHQASPDLEMVFTPYAEFEQKYFGKISKKAKILGCDADFRWDGVINPRPKIMDKPFRTAAGHIHIGWTEGESGNNPSHFEDCRFISHRFYFKTKLIAFPFDVTSPLQTTRLQYYGMEGSFRAKSYGVELRQPSNEWVEDPENNVRMYNLIVSEMNKLKVNW